MNGAERHHRRQPDDLHHRGDPVRALGSGPVRGFSVTLGIGILTSVFTAIFVTRLFIVTWFDRRRPKTIEV
jgi:preprotein translocase subunit SecD